VTTVRDDPDHPDPAFADLYAALPEPATDDELWPWLDWCRAAAPPVLYLGIGAGRLAAPLQRRGLQLVGVDVHPGMLAHLRRRLPGLASHRARIETLELGVTFDLVIGPSSVLSTPASLAAAARHASRRVGLELMNPHWLAGGLHPGVRLDAGGGRLEVDYRLGDGRTVTQVVDPYAPGPAPERIEDHLAAAGLRLEWMGGHRGLDLKESPTYFVLAHRDATPARDF
jgi:hypothetical protein